jgi:hypothetical protein
MCSTLTGAGQTVGIFSEAPIKLFDIFGGFGASGGYIDQQNSPLFRADWPQPLPGSVEQVVLNPAILAVGSPDLYYEEVTLDVEAVLAIAPSAHVVVYVGSTPDDIYAAMADDSGLTSVSSSFADYEDANSAQSLAVLAARGVAAFIASGDDGAISDPEDMTDLPNQTVVGGSVLTTTSVGIEGTSPAQFWQYCPPSGGNPDCYYATEDIATFSGGGVMNGYAESVCPCYPESTCCHGASPPWYQAEVANVIANAGGDVSWRNFPDVAAVATNFFSMHTRDDLTTIGGPVSGTSVASPLWAGFAALVNEYAASHGVPPVGFVSPAIYEMGATRGLSQDLYTNVFHDVSDMRFNTGNLPGFESIPGYDLVTGWGTPSCAVLQQLGSDTPLAPTTFEGIHVHLVNGSDGVNDTSTVYLDVLDNSHNVMTTFLLKSLEQTGWNDLGGVHDASFFFGAGSPPIPPVDASLVGGVALRIDDVMGHPDNWDVAAIGAQLFNPLASTTACIANLQAENGCLVEFPSCTGGCDFFHMGNCATGQLPDSTPGVLQLRARSEIT